MSAVEHEIVLDLPFPPSINRLWRIVGRRMVKSKEYVRWLAQADMTVMAAKQYPKRKIGGHFSVHVALSSDRGADGDNCAFKATLDWCQSRDIIRNDRDCCQGSFEWVAPDQAPAGCRVTLRSIS